MAAAAGLVDSPAAPGPRRRTTRRAVTLGVAAAVCVAGVLVWGWPAGTASQDAWAARTYAALSKGGFVHFVLRTSVRRAGEVRYTQRLERWQLGSRVRTNVTTRSSKLLKTETMTDGRTVLLYDVTNGVAGRNAVNPAHRPDDSDPFSIFLRRYRAGAVRDAGEARFRGATVRRLVVRTPLRALEYLISKRSAIPIAIRVTERSRFVVIQGRQRTVRYAETVVRTTQVVTYEKLASTPANLAALSIDLPPNVRMLPDLDARH